MVIKWFEDSSLESHSVVKKAADYYNNDHTHTSLKGAHMNAKSIADGLKLTDCPLKQYLK